MKTLLTVSALLLASSAAAASAQTPASPQGTSFAIRVAPSTGSTAAASVVPAQLTEVLPGTSTTSLTAAVAIASRLGRVTSTRRSVTRNRAVGGAPNSYHLSGRAIDVVPHAGVRHADIAVALRRAGFQLVESLDEGDHSHFAFGTGAARRQSFQPKEITPKEVTQWRMVTAPRMASR